MSKFLTALREKVLLADGAAGSLLFERTGRMSERNHVYECLNLDAPELIRELHRSYLQAGAQCLKSNTFGANASKLLPQGELERLAACNEAGVRLARECAAVTDGFVLASVGPATEPLSDRQTVARIYDTQLRALAAAGPDAFLLETFAAPDELAQLITYLREIDQELPIIAHLTTGHAEAGWQTSPAPALTKLAALGVAVVGVNCCAPWEAESFLDAVQDLEPVRSQRVLLSAMPNAGGFQRIDDRYMTSVNPEFLGRLARTFSQRGVRLIGGCCEVHPPHVREMSAYLRSRAVHQLEVTEQASRPPAGVAEKRDNGRFSRKLFAGEFAVSVELLPPRGIAVELLRSKLEFVTELAASGLADALDVTDGSRGIPLLPPGDFIRHARGALADADLPELEMIPHFCARDLNVMAIQSRLIGYHMAGIHNVLFITGDPPKMSPDYPRSTAVFDVDSINMIHYAAGRLNAGVDFGGSPLTRGLRDATHFTVGTGFEPEAMDLTRELQRLSEKIAAGADYVMTQPAFRPACLDCLEPWRDKVAILVGVLIVTSLAHARRIDAVPGVMVPESVFTRLSRFDDPADQAKVGEDLAVEQIERTRGDGWSGLYLMSPSSHRPITDVLRRGLS